MKVKNIVLAGLAGGIVDFLLGWLFYGFMFPAHFSEEMPNLLFILLGCLSFGFLLAYIFVRWASITTYLGGLKAGATIGLFLSLIDNFSKRSASLDVDYETFGLDVAIGIVMGALVGAVVAEVNGALSKK